MSEYISNTTLAAVAEKIRGVIAAKGRIAIFTHSKPDGDAAGSSLGVARAITEAGGGADVWHAGPLPAWIGPLFEDTPLKVIDAANQVADEYALALVLDTGAWSQLEFSKGFLTGKSERVVIVDHHRHGDADIAALRYVDTDAAAVCEIAAGLCPLITESGLSRGVAHALYLGMATDTGWFRHSNVTGRLLRAAAACVEAGAKPSELYQLTEQQDRLQRLKLLARALNSLELLAEDRVAIMTLSAEDFAATGAGIPEAGGFVDFPAMMPSVRVVAVLTETTDANGAVMTKISFRSKTATRRMAAIDVNTIAQQFGGGGHFAAAGGRTSHGLTQTREAVAKALTTAVAKAMGG